ncbi:thioredoxin family protein [Virgibacillus salexigens]|uniref:thioredoxin family protein n=1 Tax=Virgibacillus massiliensis TaxID=1462526 RepID=UPI00136A0FAF|nr:thioredoxin family protein [Virgibacillus massiliensis]MYL43298.1 thioredoxin [Virgibacillus massiliensis]
MHTFQELKQINDINSFIEEHELAFLFISREGCSVCHSLLPQVQQLLTDYPQITAGHIRAELVEEVASRFSIFTVPVLLLFVNGKEYIREARIVHLDLLEAKIKRIYKNVVGTD